MSENRIPPGESHPRYKEWLQASIRRLKGEQKLQGMSHVPETDPEFAAAYTEWLAAKKDYESLCENLINSVEVPQYLRPQSSA